MTAPAPYDRSIFHGRLLDNATIAALKIAEDRLGYELTIVQGIGGAVASAGTHLEGRAVDLAAWDHADKVKVLRSIGFAAWYRAPLPGVWGEHVHGILIFEGRDNHRGLAESGWRQIGSYDRGRNGLANDGDDPNNFRPSPPAVFTLAEYRDTFDKPKPRPEKTDVTRARNQLVVTLHELSQTIALIGKVDEDREHVKQLGERLEKTRDRIRKQLERMPKR